MDRATTDTAILWSIKHGVDDFHHIHQRLIRSGHLERDQDRILDRRLQSLRKREVIYFDAGHWRLTPESIPVEAV